MSARTGIEHLDETFLKNPWNTPPSDASIRLKVRSASSEWASCFLTSVEQEIFTYLQQNPIDISGLAMDYEV